MYHALLPALDCSVARVAAAGPCNLTTAHLRCPAQFITCLVAYGTRESATFNFIFKGANIILIVIILCLSFPHANKQNWADFWHFGDAGVFGAAAVVFFAYNGAPVPPAWCLARLLS